MRTLEEIEADLAKARVELAAAEGTPTEVYSRIVGYYRSVRNWNKGKREEYGERKLYVVADSGEAKNPEAPALAAALSAGQGRSPDENHSPADAAAPVLGAASFAPSPQGAAIDGDNQLVLFVRPACPACPTAKDAASRLGIPVDLVDADTDAGLERAARMNVMATPTAILLSSDGRELARARDARSIAAFAALTGGQALTALRP